MEQKINLDKFLGDLREELCNRNLGFLIAVIDAALKQQHIGIYDGIVVKEDEQKPTRTNSLKEFPKEGQRWYICTKDVWDKCYATPAFLKGEYATFDNILSKCSNTKRLFSEILSEHFRRATEDDLQKKKQNSIKFEEKPDTNQTSPHEVLPQVPSCPLLHGCHSQCLRDIPLHIEGMRYTSLYGYYARLLELICSNLSCLSDSEVLPALNNLQKLYQEKEEHLQSQVRK